VKVNLREIQLSKSRPTNPETVNALAASMRESGLISPVIVRKGPIFDGAVMVQGYKVVVGNHRVSAARALGWEEIDAFLHDGDELHAELLEIDENLQRAELSPAQRAASIARRKELWEILHPESSRRNPPTGNIGYGNPPPAAKSFAADTQERTGESDRRTREHLARAASLGPDLHAVIGTSLDKGVELDALKDMPADERRDLIDRAKAGENVSARLQVRNADGYVSTLMGDFARMASKYSVAEVAESVARTKVNPDLHAYVEAVFNGFRAARKRAA